MIIALDYNRLHQFLRMCFAGVNILAVDEVHGYRKHKKRLLQGQTKSCQ